MTDYGFKVSKPGYSVLTATPQQLIFSSKYTTLRVQSRGSGTVTDSGGRIATIAHGLGYVPMFVVNATIYGGSTDYYTLPYVNDSNVSQAWCWADSTNIYIKVSSTFGYQEFTRNGHTYNSAYRGTYSGVNVGLGADLGEVGGSTYDGALRFEGITLAYGQTPVSAKIHFYIEYRNGAGDDVYGTLYGIEEANTAAFNTGTAVFDRPKHDGSSPVSLHIGAGAQDGSTDIWDVTAIVGEIAGTGGWASGNAMGFLFFNNASSDAEIESDDAGYTTKLVILPSNTLLNYKYTIFKDKIE